MTTSIQTPLFTHLRWPSWTKPRLQQKALQDFNEEGRKGEDFIQNNQIQPNFVSLFLFYFTQESQGRTVPPPLIYLPFLPYGSFLVCDLMSKKNKGAIVESMPPYGVGGFVDAKARQKHQILTQDYEELRKEADAMSANLELAKQRRLVLAAEVRFLRQRYKHLVKTNHMNASQEQLLEAPAAHKQVKNSKERIASRKEASRLRLPPLPTSKPKKNKCTAKVAVGNNTSQLTVVQPGDSFIPSSVLNKNGRTHTAKEALAPYFLPILESGSKERTYSANDAAALRHSITAFDLNQHNSWSVEAASLSSHAPIFDLNQVSTGDADNQNIVKAIKLEEAEKSLVRGMNDDRQNELKFSICRNAGGEGPARVGKRKISWQDPVALRV